MVTASAERQFFHVVIRATFIAVGVATVVSLFSPAYWFADLFSHFRLYFLIAQALLALTFLHSGHRFLLALTLLMALPNAWYVVPYLTPLVTGGSVAATGSGEVSIIAFNVNYQNDGHAAVRDYLAVRSPDVVVIEELTDDWQAALRNLDADYPYHVGRSRADPYGLGVWSRLPFVESELIDLGVPGSVNARVVLDTGGRPLQIFAVHLFLPLSARGAEQRNRQLDTLASHLSATDLSTLVIGDLNLTPFSPYFASFVAAAGLVDARQPFGFHFTWPTSAWPLWIPIDHALVTRSLDIGSVRRGLDAGSDHYPLEVSVTCCGPGSGLDRGAGSHSGSDPGSY
jgi:endonuclease/exonuclease/phosphatase (EEP) superfamily protein YafD